MGETVSVENKKEDIIATEDIVTSDWSEWREKELIQRFSALDWFSFQFLFLNSGEMNNDWVGPFVKE